MYANILLAVAAAMSPFSSVQVTSDDERHITVNAADLDLAKPDDAARLTRRLNIAVRRVCTTPDRQDVSGMALRTQCMRLARDSSRPQVERMILAATAKGGTQVAAR